MINNNEKRITSRIKVACFIALTIVLTAVAFGVGTRVGAANGEAGSMTDPLITDSYLEKRLSELGGSYSCNGAAKGDSLTFPAGGKFVLYSGNATAKGSLVDLTDGNLLKSGGTVQPYHEYLVPSDNSGLKMGSDGLVFSAK